jgi:hypothetical protein
MGNTTVDRFRTTRGWKLGGRPYVERLYRDRGFRRAMARRWREVRAAGLRRRILAGIARDVRRLARPQVRNFRRWPVLGRYVWPNPVDPRTGRYRPSWRSEVAYLTALVGSAHRLDEPGPAGARPPQGLKRPHGGRDRNRDRTGARDGGRRPPHSLAVRSPTGLGRP